MNTQLNTKTRQLLFSPSFVTLLIGILVVIILVIIILKLMHREVILR